MIYFVFGLVLLIAIFVFIYYNKMVKAYHQLYEAFSGIDIQLKRRANLVPALYDLAEQKLNHEDKLLTELSALQSQSLALQGKNSPERQQIEQNIAHIMQQTLKKMEADNIQVQGYLALKNEFMLLEDELQMARRYYNGCVRDYNILLESFPNNLLASSFGFQKAEYLEEE